MTIIKETAIHIPVSSCCNNDCRFCMEPHIDHKVNLDRKFIFRILKKYMFERADRVLFTNKEPTLNPDLPRYIEYAKKIGYKKIALVTNGRRFSSLPYCRDLLQKGLNHITVSIHGPDPRIHDLLTRRKGSFQETLKGLKNLSSLKKYFGFTFITSTVLSRPNYPHTGRMLKLLSGFPADQIILQCIECRGRKMSRNFSSLMIRYSDVIKEIKKTDRNYKGPRFHVLGLPYCVAGKGGKNFHLGYTENIKLLGNKGRLNLIDYSSKYGTLKRKECARCRAFLFCRGIFKPYIRHYGWKELKP
ncbi:MAG: radical SAM protein [bacterium]|nr:radical SAM protein [bacterium]